MARNKYKGGEEGIPDRIEDRRIEIRRDLSLIRPPGARNKSGQAWGSGRRRQGDLINVETGDRPSVDAQALPKGCPRVGSTSSP